MHTCCFVLQLLSLTQKTLRVASRNWSQASTLCHVSQSTEDSFHFLSLSVCVLKTSLVCCVSYQILKPCNFFSSPNFLSLVLVLLSPLPSSSYLFSPHPPVFSSSLHSCLLLSSRLLSFLSSFLTLSFSPAQLKVKQQLVLPKARLKYCRPMRQ